MSKLKNKVAVITGTSKGIGAAIATAYGEEGAGNVLGPNQLLVFEVTLEKVIKAGKPAAPAAKPGK